MISGHHTGHARGHYRGHYTGHLADRVARAIAGVPFSFDYVWLGRAEDVVQGETLVQVGTAQQGVQPTGYNPSAWRDALFRFPATTDAWQAADASRVTFGESYLAVTIFRAQTAPLSATANLAGDRDPVAPNLGHEHSVGPDGRVIFIADSAGGQVTIQVVGDHVSSLLPFVVAVRVRPGFADLETLLGSATGVLPAGTLSNAVRYAIGRQRILASPSLEIGFHAVAVDQAYLPHADLREEVLFPIARELVLAPVYDADGQPVIDADGHRGYAHTYPYV